MGNLFVAGLENVRHQHEREAASHLLQLLREVVPTQDAFLVFSAHIGAEIDCLLLASTGAVIGELKQWPYHVVGRMNGAWLRQRGSDALEVLAGDATPYHQAQKQRSRLSRLLQQEIASPAADGTDSWSRYIQAGLVQCPRLRIDFVAYNSPWWFQDGLDEFGARIRSTIETSGQIDTKLYMTLLRKLGLIVGSNLPKIHEVLAEEFRLSQGRVATPTESAAQQKPAGVRKLSPHKLVLAGAGAGKTQHMACQIVAALGVDSGAQLYAISYTNRARDILKERVHALLESDTDWHRIRFGTIHQFAQALSRPLAEPKKLIPPRSLVESLSVPEPGRAIDPKTLEEMRRAVCASDGNRVDWLDSWHADAWQQLLGELSRRGETTFEGLLLDGINACDKTPVVPSHVFVDEFQDTNGLQFEILKRLAARGTIITVVGDGEQAIYGFAGALKRPLDTFAQQFAPEVEELASNHRSAQRVVALANKIRTDGRHQSASRLVEGKVRLLRQPSLRRIAEAVATEIAEQVGQGEDSIRTCGDFAVLARTRAELSHFETALRARRVPVHGNGAQSFHELRQVPKLLKLLHALDQPDDLAELAGALQHVGNVDAAREVRSALAGIDASRAPLSVAALSFTTRAAVLAMQSQLHAIRESSSSAASQVRALFDQFVVPILGIFDRAPTRLTLLNDDVAALARFAEFAAVSPSALARMVEEDHAIAVIGAEGVRLATIHEAKGDEWQSVYIANIGLTSFPHPAAIDLDEERRLFYVACTRAADELTLCHGDGQQLSRFVSSAVKGFEKDP
jgi:DNA helicase II / ATP-dependent DNA helicase PcrA